MIAEYEDLTFAVVYGTLIDKNVFNILTSSITTCCNHDILPYMKYCPLCAKLINNNINVNDMSGDLSAFVAKDNMYYLGYVYDTYETCMRIDSPYPTVIPSLQFTNIEISTHKANHTQEEMMEIIIDYLPTYTGIFKTYVIAI